MFGSPWPYAAISLIATAVMIVAPVAGAPRWLNVIIWIISLPLAIWSVRQIFGAPEWRTPYGDDDSDHLYLRHPHSHRPVAPPDSRRKGEQK